MTTPDNGAWGQGDRVPIPDPTILTNVAIDRVTSEYRREIVMLKELLEIRMTSIESSAVASWNFQDEATKSALAAAKEAVVKAEESTKQQFVLMGTSIQRTIDLINGSMPRAEYQAAHEALSDTVSELRNQLNTLVPTVVPRNETDAWRTSVVERIAALELRITSRLDLGEGADKGSALNREQHRLDGAYVTQVILAIVAVGSLIATLILAFKK